MSKPAVAYQEERPNVEVSDLTVLVIQALGLLASKMVKEQADNGDVCDIGDVYRKKQFFLTAAITNAAHLLIGPWNWILILIIKPHTELVTN